MSTLRAVRILVPALLLTATVASPALAETPASSPSSTLTPCGAPAERSVSVNPNHIAVGDTATATIKNVQYPCHPGQEPTHHETLLARQAGTTGPYTAVAEADTDANGIATFAVSPPDSTQYTFASNDVYSTRYPSATLIVDRVSGSCANVVTLAAPATVPTGGVVHVNGTAPDTGTVNILFRKRGQTTFQVRRALTPRADRTFSTAFVADDDYRLYASGDRCDSQPLLVQAQPVITGPSTVRRGSTVTLVLRAPAGVPVKVYFHRAGTSGYEARRSGTVSSSGRYVTTYVADADYRYYAVTGPGVRASNGGLTQTSG